MPATTKTHDGNMSIFRRSGLALEPSSLIYYQHLCKKPACLDIWLFALLEKKIMPKELAAGGEL